MLNATQQPVQCHCITREKARLTDKLKTNNYGVSVQSRRCDFAIIMTEKSFFIDLIDCEELQQVSEEASEISTRQ